MKNLLLLALVLVIGLISAPTSSEACACCGTWKVTNVASFDSLNIRSGPGIGFGVTGAIPSESACVIKSDQCQGGWCKISYAEFNGWVNTKYLRWKP